MKIKVLVPIIIIGLVLALTYHFIAIASIDAPHNESSSISCGTCHGQGLLNSPFWGGSGTFDQICTSCHTALSGPYSEIAAPFAKTHSSENTSNKYGTWGWECRNCHDPHYQKQKNYKDSDASNLYLATGTITGCVYNGDGTSTLTYSSITYKTGWDAAKIIDKTEKGGSDKRSAILFPNVSKLGYSYPVTAIDGSTITVKGNATPVYQYISSSTFAIMYGQYIKQQIKACNITTDQGCKKDEDCPVGEQCILIGDVKFFDKTGVGSFADGFLSICV
jgi:hypothetical protein